MKKKNSWTIGVILPVGLIVVILVLTAKTIMGWRDSPRRGGPEQSAKLGSAVLFQPNEKQVRADFDNEIRIVIVPPKHCITYEPKAVVEVLKKAERTVKVMVRHRATVTFQKYPLTDPKCQS